MKLISTKEIRTKIKETVSRFPFASSFAFLAGTTVMFLTEYHKHAKDTPDVLKVLFPIFILGIPFFTAIKLYSEYNQLSKKRRSLFRTAGLSILLCLYFVFSNYNEGYSLIRYFQYCLFFHLLCSFAPFIGNPNTNAFWQLNRRLFFNFLLSATVTIIFYIGTIGAIAAVTYLLEFKIFNLVYIHIWFFSVFIFNTILFLNLIPKDLKKLANDNEYSPLLKKFIQYLFVPLIGLYIVILYIYFAKILLVQELPKGMITYLISTVAIIGTLVHLFLFPYQGETEEGWIKKWIKFFQLSLLPLIALLFFSAYVRINEYGLTESRYFIVILGAWLLLVTLYLGFKNRKGIAIIPQSLALICLLTSFGPWGAFQMSENSQVKRLAEILEKNQILIRDSENRLSIQKTENKIKRNDRRDISSIVDYLRSRHGLQKIAPWFKDDLKIKKNEVNNYWPQRRFFLGIENHYLGSNQVMDVLGLEYMSKQEQRYNSNTLEDSPSKYEYFSFSSENNNTYVRTSNFQYMAPFDDLSGYVRRGLFALNSSDPKDSSELVFSLDDKKAEIVVSINEEPLLKIELLPLIDLLLKEPEIEIISAQIANEKMILRGAYQDIPYLLFVKNVNGTKTEDMKLKIHSISGTLLFSTD